MEAAEVKAWRRSERKRLLELRLAMPPSARRAANRAIAEQLFAVLVSYRRKPVSTAEMDPGRSLSPGRAERGPGGRDDEERMDQADPTNSSIATPGITLGAYWPLQGEFDPRPLIDRLIAEGWHAALPAVVDRKGPLEYRRWRPGEPLVAGIWDIPVPERRDIAVPEAVLVPLLGFDRQCYRLGYGGGYFDRTLAALMPPPAAIGVGYELSLIETIYPQAFDIPMDFVVTEAGSRRR